MSRTTKKIINKILPIVGEGVKELGKFVKDFLLRNSKILIILPALLWFWDNKVDTSLLEGYLSSNRSEFKEGEIAKIYANYRDDTLIIHEKGKEPKLIAGVKSFDGSQFADGTIELDYKNKGIGLEPGFVATVGDGLRLGLDVEYAYWKRWGLLVGTTYPVNGRSLDRLRGHLGLGYDIPNRWFSNTSVWGGLDSNKSPALGIRTKFGGGI
jgi:hypothetical protein